MGLSHSGAAFPAPNHPWLRDQTIRDHYHAPEPTENTQLWLILCLFTLFLPAEPTINLLLPFSSIPSASWLTLVLLHGPCVVWSGTNTPFGNCNKLSFQWPSSPDLLASPYLNNNKPYIIKHFEIVTQWEMQEGEDAEWPHLFLLSELWHFRKGIEEPVYKELPSLMNWVEDTWTPSIIMALYVENYNDFWQHNSIHWKKVLEQILVYHNWCFLLLVLKPKQIRKHLLGIWGNWSVWDCE